MAVTTKMVPVIDASTVNLTEEEKQTLKGLKFSSIDRLIVSAARMNKAIKEKTIELKRYKNFILNLSHCNAVVYETPSGVKATVIEKTKAVDPVTQDNVSAKKVFNLFSRINRLNDFFRCVIVVITPLKAELSEAELAKVISSAEDTPQVSFK